MATEKQIEAGKRNLDNGRQKFTSESGRANQPKSLEQRKFNKKGRELAQAILDAVLRGDELKAIQDELGVSEELTREAAMHIAQAKDASMGGPGSAIAYKAILTAAGRYEEKQTISVEELPERLTPSEAIDYVAQMNK